jgi:hypothetical protein
LNFLDELCEEFLGSFGMNFVEKLRKILDEFCEQFRKPSEPNGAFTLDVMFKSVLNENLGGILGGMQC